MATKSTRLADQLGNEVIPFHCHNLRRIDVYTICQEWGYNARDCDFHAFRPASLGQVVVDAEPDNIDTFRAWADAREAEAEIARQQWDEMMTAVASAKAKYDVATTIGDVRLAIFYAKAIRVELACRSDRDSREYPIPDWAKTAHDVRELAA